MNINSWIFKVRCLCAAVLLPLSVSSCFPTCHSFLTIFGPFLRHSSATDVALTLRHRIYFYMYIYIYMYIHLYVSVNPFSPRLSFSLSLWFLLSLPVYSGPFYHVVSFPSLRVTRRRLSPSPFSHIFISPFMPLHSRHLSLLSLSRTAGVCACVSVRVCASTRARDWLCASAI